MGFWVTSGLGKVAISGFGPNLWYDVGWELIAIDANKGASVPSTKTETKVYSRKVSMICRSQYSHIDNFIETWQIAEVRNRVFGDPNMGNPMREWENHENGP